MFALGEITSSFSKTTSRARAREGEDARSLLFERVDKEVKEEHSRKEEAGACRALVGSAGEEESKEEGRQKKDLCSRRRGSFFRS